MTADTADGVDREHDRALVERAIRAFDAGDPKLMSVEKETTFRFSSATNEIRFFTAEPGVGRRLLAHPSASIKSVVVAVGDDRPGVGLEEVQEADDVVGVRGVLPIGALGIRASPRESTGHAEIVSQRVFEGVDP